jgi:SAM-dependent methyltransferase
LFELMRRILFRYTGLDMPFNHKRAQEYEIKSSENSIKNNFEWWYAWAETVKSKRERSPGIDEMGVDGFYGGSEEVWAEVAAHVEGRTCLEIGPGPCGNLAGWWWAKRRIFIDPLIDEYKRISLKYFNKTLYTDEMELYARCAEDFIPELEGTVDGVIICRNALDHCKDPTLVLKNIAAYAKPGCYLLLWTDLWHLRGHDVGHSNITKDKEGFEKNIMDLGFEILYTFDGVRQDGSTIEYGCRARKVVLENSE